MVSLGRRDGEKIAPIDAAGWRVMDPSRRGESVEMRCIRGSWWHYTSHSLSAEVVEEVYDLELVLVLLEL